MTKGIYNFYWDCGRSGDLSGTFIADSEAVANIIGKDIYFGEVLGKHSEVYGVIEEGEITLVNDDQEFIAKFEQILGVGWSSGYSPFDYYDHEQGEEE